MEHRNEIAMRIAKRFPETARINAQEWIRLEFTIFANDFTKLCINIRETSMNTIDKSERIAALSEKTGISIIHLTQLIG